jgi:hypothetical protein
MLKTCFKCKIEKPISEFYKHPETSDGYLGKCKSCTKLDAKENRKNNPRVREYDRERSKFSERKEYVLETQRKRRRKNPEKYIANLKVHRAIISGKMIKLPCSICGNKNSQAHHEDYNKPLNIIWLCQTHHDIRHSELGWG